MSSGQKAATILVLVGGRHVYYETFSCGGTLQYCITSSVQV